MGDTSRARTLAHARGATHEGESSNLPPPPSMVQLMAMYETNRADDMRLLERIERNTAQRQNNQVGIKDFTRLTTPVLAIPLSHMMRTTGFAPWSANFRLVMLLKMIG